VSVASSRSPAMRFFEPALKLLDTRRSAALPRLPSVSGHCRPNGRRMS
jgi:hypothetical protein